MRESPEPHNLPLSGASHPSNGTEAQAADPAILWGERALFYARSIASLALVRTTPEGQAPPLHGRGSATAAEAQAAETVRQHLTCLGIENVRTQSFQGLRSIWLFFSLAFGFALAGHAAFWLLGPIGQAGALGQWPGLVISTGLFAFTGIMIWRKFTFRNYALRQSLPHGPSQNVIAVLPPTGEVQRRVVLLGHLDSHRAVLWYANDFLVRLCGRLAVPLVLYGVYLAPLLYVLAVLTGWSFFAYIGLGLGLPHFLAWLSGMTADLGPYSPGANDNASAVGTLLGLAEKLRQEPLQHTEVWLAFTGCEETGCDGLLALLQQHGEELKDAFWLDFELVGMGERLVYLNREGVLRKQGIPPGVEAQLIAAAVKAGVTLEKVNAGGLGVFTETGALWEHGFQAACIVSMRQGSDLLPEWHRLTDTPDRLESASLGRAHALAWALLQDE